MTAHCWWIRPGWCSKGHRVTGLGVHTHRHTHSRLPFTLPPSPVQQVPQCDLDWESAKLGMWVYEHWSCGTTWGGSVTARLWSRQAGGTEGDRLSQTGPWVTFHWTRPAPLMSAFRCLLTVGASLHLCLFHITLADHPYLKKCPARFKFSQECGPSEHPTAHLDPS